MKVEGTSTDEGIYPRGFSSARKWPWPLVQSEKLVVLNYGKALRDGDRQSGNVPVYGTNGRCGWHDKPLTTGPGVILGRKGQGPLGVEWCDSDFWVIDTAYFVTRKTEQLDLRYFYYLVKYIGLNHLKDGTSNPSLSRPTFYDLLLPVPPLHTQCGISRFLATLDERIDLNRRMNQTLEAIGRTLFEEWFPGVITSDGQTSSHLFGEIASASRESLSPLQYPKETFDHYSIPAYDEGQLPIVEEGRQIKSNKFIVHANSVLLSKLNPRIPRTWLPSVSEQRRSLCSTEFIVLRPNEGWSREFVYALCNSNMFQDAFSGMVTGTSGSHQRVKPEYVEKLPVQLPPRELVARFTQVIKPAHARAALNLEQNATLTTLRDALLPELASGEVKIAQQPHAKEATL